ncbi:LIM/homeobox protein Awh-like [Branchiostoma floridae]|uniref:LIM class homeodomain transcription factor, Lhx6/8 subclass n=1 Tax=Branchiostoma floridae TaxID=7739 RepID=C3Y315_BRAFL|nr:LIM/homeobox protein Awh-like [Branchiostoma floridae]|eukprot:XP_002609417.1 LIM class homeodomain transcription factor, Lhx6/8 subclass [Branchiostoma floridae]
MSGFGTTVSPLFRTFPSPNWEALYTPCVQATAARRQDGNMSEHAEMDSELCTGCGGPIQDKFLLKVGERQWHVKCLRCSVCQTPLGRHTTCYTREADVFCKADYIRQFGTKCAKCCRNIQSNDWVRRAKTHVYHLACFACDACKRQLSTGEEFALHDGKVLCKSHYLEAMDAAAGSGNGSDCDSLYSGESGSGGHRPKRVRTTFTEEQLRVLQANFNIDSNPDGQDLERIAQITGLSKRVTQVWFQNSRARQKKYGNLTGSKSLSPGRKCCIKCGQIYCACVQSGLQATSCA